VIDGCLERGLEPWVTIHHWDMPLALFQRDGWANRDIVERFADFATQCVEHFGDRVKHWMVFNEPLSVFGHLIGGMYGGRPGRLKHSLAAVHHMNLAQAESGRRIRELAGPDTQVGTTNVVTIGHPYDSPDRAVRGMKRWTEALLCDMFFDPFAGRGYPFAANRLLNAMKPAIRDGDLEACEFTWDFIGLQYYGPVPFKQLRLGAIPWISQRAAEAQLRSEVGIPADPEGLLWVLRKYGRHPAAKRYVISESGFGGQDRLRDGRVHDDIRIWYHRAHLQAVLDARAEGIEVDGYFAWSYADNIEWFLGRRPRFGLVYIDYDHDMARIPKDSALWMQRLITTDDDV